jgi:thiol:disulfide interchange protein
MNRQGASLALLLFLFLLSLAAPAAAQLAQPGHNPLPARLVAESDTVPTGGTVSLAIRMSPEKGWHGYWKNPGDAGTETRIEWRLPQGAAASELRYPVPQRLVVAGLMNYVYEGPYALLVDFRAPRGAKTGTVLPLAAHLDYLACTQEICVPQKADVATQIVVGTGGATRRAEFDGYRSALPRPLGSDGRFAIDKGRLRLAIPFPADRAVAGAYFFPLTDGAASYGAAQSLSRAGDLLIVETQAAQGAKPATLEGVLDLGGGTGLSLRAVPGPVPVGAKPIGGPAGGGGVLLALLGAILGGLLLNVMPCVFPILSLKALSLARAGAGAHAEARQEGLAYTGGAVLTCLALGAALLALRAAGNAAGWAFQLQDPRVILLLLLLVAAIALNLAGLFELPGLGGGERLAGKGGSAGAFWTGALAAFVATPCTGPFMGAALGAALVLPAAAALAIFGGLGFGLALPFLLLGFLPALRRRLPRPGPWMERFRHILAVPMALTAIGLAWILWRQTGAAGLALGLGAVLVLAAALWTVRRRGWLLLAPAAAAGVAAALLVPQVASAPQSAAGGVLKAEPFSEARLAALRAAGRPVFVYFTADWCLTCKVNEKAAIDRDDVAAAFAAKKVAVLVGDWTRGDPQIGRFLAANGRSGVPLYLWYAPGRGPEMLPQILTPAALAQLPASSSASAVAP